MIERLKQICARYEELGREISSPDAMADMDAWRAMVKEHAQLEPLAQKSEAYQSVWAQMADCKEMMEDEDAQMRELAAQELRALGIDAGVGLSMEEMVEHLCQL